MCTTWSGAGPSLALADIRAKWFFSGRGRYVPPLRRRKGGSPGRLTSQLHRFRAHRPGTSSNKFRHPAGAGPLPAHPFARTPFLLFPPARTYPYRKTPTVLYGKVFVLVKVVNHHHHLDHRISISDYCGLFFLVKEVAVKSHLDQELKRHKLPWWNQGLRFRVGFSNVNIARVPTK